MLLLILQSVFAMTNTQLLPTDTYLPVGFDTNDTNVQIAYDGYYPDSCYKYLPPSYEVDIENREIRITNNVFHSENTICTKAISEYDKIMDLGPIPVEGTYKVLFQSPNGEMSLFDKIVVAKPKDENNIDDDYYAPVAKVKVLEMGERTKVRLIVKSNNTCLKLKEPEVSVHKNVIQVLPTMEERDPNCENDGGSVRIVKDIELNAAKGKYLLHVRSMNGKGLNQFVEL